MNNINEALSIIMASEMIIREHKYTIQQPTMQEIVEIQKNTMIAKSHIGVDIGEIASADIVEQCFGRGPRQEGINFCKSTKKLYIVTKIGCDNPLIEYAQYNDYWRMGKVYYEGRGQKGFQEMIQSNQHMYMKYMVSQNIAKCEPDVEPFVHILNKVGDSGDNYQYLGEFYVTDFYVNEHSIQKGNKTKTAIIFVLTPRCGQLSESIMQHYSLV